MPLWPRPPSLEHTHVACVPVCLCACLALPLCVFVCGTALQELFYQLKGDITVEIVDAGVPRPVHVKEGELFLLPSRVPHSPRVSAPNGLVERGAPPPPPNLLVYARLPWGAHGVAFVLYDTTCWVLGGFG